MPRKTDPTPPLSFSRPLPPNGADAVNIGLDPEIRETIEEERYLRATGQMEIDPFDSHKPVKMLQAAALFRMIDGPNVANRTAYMITHEDWELATYLYETSRQMRIELQKRIREIEMRRASAEGARLAKVQSAREDQAQNETVEKYREKVLAAIRNVEESGNNVTISRIQQHWSTKSTRQKIAEVVLPALVDEGTLTLEDGKYGVAK